jgi:hypothetical protein
MGSLRTFRGVNCLKTAATNICFIDVFWPVEEILEPSRVRVRSCRQASMPRTDHFILRLSYPTVDAAFLWSRYRTTNSEDIISLRHPLPDAITADEIARLNLRRSNTWIGVYPGRDAFSLRRVAKKLPNALNQAERKTQQTLPDLWGPEMQRLSQSVFTRTGSHCAKTPATASEGNDDRDGRTTIILIRCTKRS